MSTKTVGVESISLRYIVPNDIVTGGVFDVTNEGSVSIFFNYCQTNNTDHMIVPPTFRVEGRYSSAVEHWWTIASWQPNRTAPANATLTTSAPVGSSTLTFDAIPSFWSLEDKIFIRHQVDANPYDLTKSEFNSIIAIGETTIDLLDATKISHSVISGESIDVYNLAQKWVLQLNVLAIAELRLMIDASNCDKEFAAEAHVTIQDALA